MIDEAFQIIDFIKKNRSRLFKRLEEAELPKEKFDLIVARLDAIPNPILCHPLEIRLFFDEISRGGLEWLYQEKIGDQKIGEIARKAAPKLTVEDLQELENIHNSKLNSDLFTPEFKENLNNSLWMLSFIRRTSFIKE